MRATARTVILFVLPLLGFSLLSGPGVGRAPNVPGFFSHDARSGLVALQSKIHHQLAVTWNRRNMTPSSITGGLTAPGYSTASDKVADGVRFLVENVQLFGLKDPANELRPISQFVDDLGMTHVKYQQQIGGVTIFQGQLIVHFARDGSVAGMNGRYYPTPDVNAVPAISAENAIAIALRSLGRYSADTKSASLAFYENGLRFPLVYAVKLPSRWTPMMTVFVDANDGSVVSTDDGLRYDGPMVGSGVDLTGNSVPLHTYLWAGHYHMIDASLPMYAAPIDSLKGIIDTYDANNDTTGNGYNNVYRFIDPNNDDVFNDSPRMQAGVSAHNFVRDVYNLYKIRYNRNSWDNNGGSLINVLHYRVAYNNAFWNGVCMTYGDGDGVYFSNLAGGFDVIAHELTHGVTGSTAKLVYELQPGALNESISDAFACVMDSTNWTIGETVYTPGTPGDALRNLADPHNGHTQGEQDWQPANMSEYVNLPNDPDHDHGGVHINSGIPNKAFYNVATAIGRSEAGLIWYRALTTYLTNNSQFVDMRTSCLTSAADLFGAGSAEHQAVDSGFTAVGIDANTGSTTNLIYDDGAASTGVFENAANWELAVRFTPPSYPTNIKEVQILITGDNNSSGNGSFTLKMYDGDGSGGLPGTPIVTPYPYTPSATGWQAFTLTNVSASHEFYVSMKYDGTNEPLVGADPPPGNQRAYEFNTSSWAQLTSPNDYTLFMRATVQTPSGVVQIDNAVPKRFEVLQNYPNPFNPSTSIRYSLPTGLTVKLSVFDVNGRKVADLVNTYQEAGTYTLYWNGKSDAGVQVSSGVYFYRLEGFSKGSDVASVSQVRKMVLLK